MSKQPIKREDGQDADDYSETCTKCVGSDVVKTVGTVADFDDKGQWFYPIKFQCQAQKCGHEWTEKFMVRQ